MLLKLINLFLIFPRFYNYYFKKKIKDLIVLIYFSIGIMKMKCIIVYIFNIVCKIISIHLFLDMIGVS